MKIIRKKLNKQKGAAMLVSVIFFLFISLAIIAGLVSPAVREFAIASANFDSREAYYLAESGIEDAYYRILAGKPIGTSETLELGSSSVTTTITNVNNNEKQIESVGDASLHQRRINLNLSTSAGVSFNYGVQVGQGGISLDGSSGIVGNIYANGPITGCSSCYITGTAISGNSPAMTADQVNGTGVPGYNVVFGNNNSTQDIAQSFMVENSSPLNKVRFYIKKFSTPSDATVKIVNDASGSPSNIPIASGVLAASNVTTDYGWVDVSFSTNPMLSQNTTYWVVIDASTSSSKYYTIGASNSTYGYGVGKIGRLGSTWNNTTPTGLDYFFGIYLGGVNGSIVGEGQWNQLNIGTSGSGSAQAHTVRYVEATGSIYCKSGSGNNKLCQDQDDPPYIAFPVSDANITKWKNDASLGGIHNGDYTTPSYGTSTLGPKEITGNLSVGGSHTLYLTGTLWVHGNITVSGSAKIVLGSTYGNTSGIIVSDGWLDLGGSGQLNGTGQAGSYLLFVTTSNCDAAFCSGKNAINISGAAGSVVLNAQRGTISFTGSASAKEATAYKLSLSGSTIVNYESGLANVNFTSGPSGSWSLSGWGEE